MIEDVNGTELYYERRGSGPTILFIHGSTLDHRMWAPQLEALGSYDLITYDLRGFGRSPPPTGPFKHCEDALGLLDKLGVEHAVVVGHSIGGLYGLELACIAPERITGFAALCMSGLGTPQFPDAIKAVFQAVHTAARAGNIPEAKRLWLDTGWFATARAKPELRELIDQMVADYTGWYWLNDSPSQNIVPPVVERLETLKIPAMVIDGELDLDYNHQIAQNLATRIPDATLVKIAYAGHMANLEEPAEVNRALVALARLAHIAG